MLRPLLAAGCLLLYCLPLAAQDSLSFGGIDLPGAEVRARYVRVSPLAQAFTIEEVRRLPATFYDPARLIALLPGTVQTNDQANHLSVRGNTPNANLWRLNGLAIVNPNHTSNAGTDYDTPTLSGGGTNALSAQVLDNSAFLPAGLPARYGHATGGTFDLRLRPGNAERRQHQLQASFVGLDAATEGPIGRRGASYLVNGRYSFTGLLADMGVDFGGEEIRFADLNAHLHQETNRGSYSLFTVLGRSTNRYTPDPDEEITEQKQLFDIDFASDLAIVGANFAHRLPSGALTGGAAYSTLATERDQTLAADSRPVSNGSLDQHRISAFLDLERELTQQTTLNAGVELLHDGVTYDARYVRFFDVADTRREPRVRSIAPYVASEILSGNGDRALELIARLAYYDLRASGHDRFVFEPRVRYRHRWRGQRVVVTAERVSQAAPAGLLLTTSPTPVVPVNNQLTAAYGRSFGGVSALLTAYGQYTPQDFAAERNGFLLSANNLLEIDPTLSFTTLTATRRRGLELELAGGERTTGWYYRGSTSVYRAESRQTDGSWSRDRYSGDYAAKLTLGREWAGTDRRARERTYGLNLALVSFGGLRTGRITNGLNAFSPYLVPPDYSGGLTESTGVYFRPDLRLYRTRERGNRTTTLSLDVQNVAGVANTATVYFDSYLNRPYERKGLSLIPVLSYRVHWR